MTPLRTGLLRRALRRALGWWYGRRKDVRSTKAPRMVSPTVLRDGVLLVAVPGEGVTALKRRPLAASRRAWRLAGDASKSIAGRVVTDLRVPVDVRPSDFGLPYAVIVDDTTGFKYVYGPEDDMTPHLKQ